MSCPVQRLPLTLCMTRSVGLQALALEWWILLHTSRTASCTRHLETSAATLMLF